MKLQIHSTAPDFSTTDIYGKAVQLSQLKGKKILLSFFRNVACPFCNLRVHQLNKLAPELKENGLEMIFVFETPKKFILISSLHSKLQATVISDAEKALYKLYHIENSALKLIGSMFKSGFKAQMKMAKSLDLDNFEDEKKVSTIIPADFLIDANGQIANLHYGSAINDHIDIAAIKAFASKPVGSQEIL
jgi:peroxiredoxin